MKKKLLIILILLLINLSSINALVLSHGSTRDLVQGYDKGLIWYHMYLKNDHTTAYCFDNPLLIAILKDSQENKKEVIVFYETYLFRGFFCYTSEKFDNVIIVDVKYANSEGEKNE